MKSKTVEQNEKLRKLLMPFFNSKKQILFNSEKHSGYLNWYFNGLPDQYRVVDSSKPWFLFWVFHSADIINKIDEIDASSIQSTLDYLKAIKCPKTGAYGGSYGYINHTATTYASICCLIIIGTEEALESIDRKALYQYFLSLKTSDGGFSVHKNGESDVRGAYTVIAAASLLNILTPELSANVVEWIKKCQSYEGGFGGEPFDEAHGAYSFCAIATLILLDQVETIDLKKFIGWAIKRQMPFEKGFNGRTNKLIDGCYSFWIGSLFPMLRNHLQKSEKLTDLKNAAENSSLFYDRQKLIKFLFQCCQGDNGAFRDKPGVNFDLYHTGCCLSGLTINQWGFNEEKIEILNEENHPVILNEIDWHYNVCKERVERARKYFSKLG